MGAHAQIHNCRAIQILCDPEDIANSIDKVRFAEVCLDDHVFGLRGDAWVSLVISTGDPGYMRSVPQRVCCGSKCSGQQFGTIMSFGHAYTLDGLIPNSQNS